MSLYLTFLGRYRRPSSWVEGVSHRFFGDPMCNGIVESCSAALEVKLPTVPQTAKHLDLKLKLGHDLRVDPVLFATLNFQDSQETPVKKQVVYELKPNKGLDSCDLSEIPIPGPSRLVDLCVYKDRPLGLLESGAFVELEAMPRVIDSNVVGISSSHDHVMYTKKGTGRRNDENSQPVNSTQSVQGDKTSGNVTSGNVTSGDISTTTMTFGRGDWGQMGIGHTENVPEPFLASPQQAKSESAVIEALTHETVTGLSCGGNHSAVLTASGKVYTWGRDSHGQLGQCRGVGDMFSNQKYPGVVLSLARQGVVPTLVDCSPLRTVVAGKNGQLFACGALLGDDMVSIPYRLDQSLTTGGEPILESAPQCATPREHGIHSKGEHHSGTAEKMILSPATTQPGSPSVKGGSSPLAQGGKSPASGNESPRSPPSSPASARASPFSPSSARSAIDAIRSVDFKNHCAIVKAGGRWIAVGIPGVEKFSTELANVVGCENDDILDVAHSNGCVVVAWSKHFKA